MHCCMRTGVLERWIRGFRGGGVCKWLYLILGLGFLLGCMDGVSGIGIFIRASVAESAGLSLWKYDRSDAKSANS